MRTAFFTPERLGKGRLLLIAAEGKSPPKAQLSHRLQRPFSHTSGSPPSRTLAAQNVRRRPEIPCSQSPASSSPDNAVCPAKPSAPSPRPTSQELHVFFTAPLSQRRRDCTARQSPPYPPRGTLRRQGALCPRGAPAPAGLLREFSPRCRPHSRENTAGERAGLRLAQGAPRNRTQPQGPAFFQAFGAGTVYPQERTVFAAYSVRPFMAPSS